MTFLEDEQAPTNDTAGEFLGSASPAYAVDAEGLVRGWNEGAETVLGWKAREAIGRVCSELVSGNDLFGNSYCGDACPMRAIARAGRDAAPFLVALKARDGGRVTARIRVVAHPEPGPGCTRLVHLLEPATTGRLEELVGELRASARGEQDGPASAGTPSPLTSREREIILLLSYGFLSLNIAARLDLSRATVRNHIQNILKKLGVHGQVEATALALRKGWI